MIIKNQPEKVIIGGRRALLIHPPIFDTQYWAYWAQPHGLLKVASWLRSKGYTHLRLLDSLATNKDRKVKSTKLREVKIDDVVRNVRHYGWSFEVLKSELEKHALNSDSTHFFPDEIWVTSIMTYWWKSTQKTIEIIEEVFTKNGKKVPRILVGGIYPTLYPEHADMYLRENTNLNDDDLVVVDGEICSEAADSWTDLSLYNDPIYENRPKYSLITGSRGCPFNCAYCAQLRLNDNNRKVRDRGPETIAEEMYQKYVDFGVTEFAFYEDNLLFNREEFLERLAAIRRKGLKVTIYAPEGIEPRLVELELMTEMRQTGFKKMHLALETTDDEIAKKWNRRQATIAKFDRAIDVLKQAGFKVGSQDINAFVLFGMPGENLQAAMNTALYASTRVGSVVPMLFTPVPGSIMFNDYLPILKEKYHHIGDEPFKHLDKLNGKLLPFLEFNRRNHPSLRASDYLEVESLMMHLNASKVHGKRFDFNSASVAGRAFREAMAVA
jgi:radical SAM superfamily enzyme YgiQ (UPF0313 family)